MRKFFKGISMLLAVIIMCTSVSVVSFADTPQSYTVFTGEKKLEGWYPAFITSWIDPPLMNGFIDAIQQPGAVIEITYKGNSSPSIMFQSGDYGGHLYPNVSYHQCKIKNVGDKKVATFDASGIIKVYTDKKHDEDGKPLRLDHLMNFGIGGDQNVVTSVVVKWTVKGSPAVKFDVKKTYQTFDGWGASYTWYGDWLTSNIHAEKAYDWIFKDCGFNILRFRDLNKVRGYGGGFEDTTYKSYKAYYEAAKKRGIDPIVMVTSWGQYDRELNFVKYVPKDNEGHTYYTLAKNSKGEYMYDELAKFCVQSIKYFQEAGIPVDYFAISNETELQGLHIDETGKAREEAGFYFGPDENEYHCAYWKAHIAIYKAFKEAFGDKAPKIMGAEVMADTASLMKNYLNPLIKEAPESFDTIAHHLYGSANTPQSFKEVREAFPDYTLWQTEWYTNDFFKHAETIINELNYENVNAYLYWNGVWPPDDANCLIEIGDWPANSYVKRRGNHYIMMHFSKFIKNGYKRVDVSLNASKSKATAFLSPEGDELVLVLLNNTKDDEHLKLQLGDYKIKQGRIYQTTRKTTDFNKEQQLNEYMKDLGWLKYYSIDAPADTLTTLVMKIYPKEAK